MTFCYLLAFFSLFKLFPCFSENSFYMVVCFSLNAYFLVFLFICFMYVGILPCMLCLRTTCMQCPWSPEESVRSSGTQAADYSMPPGKCWEMSPGLLEEQLELLTTKPSL